MSYAAILVHARADAEAQPRLHCARALAERFGAVLIGVGAEMIPPMASGPVAGPISGEWYTEMTKVVRDSLDAAKAAFDGTARGLGDKAAWEQVMWIPGEAMATASRSADLIVASRPADGHGSLYRDAAPAELAILSGRPVLVATGGGTPLAAKRILLAWKDSREARRAMADAMPLFEKAEAVLVFEVVGEDEADAGTSTADVVKALRRRGIAAEAKVAVHAHPGAVEICSEARRFGADLIVAGAYGHTRLGEWVFGGVTRDLLAQDEIYILLSH